MYRRISNNEYSKYRDFELVMDLNIDLFSNYIYSSIEKGNFDMYIRISKYTISIRKVPDDYYIIFIYGTKSYKYDNTDEFYLCDQLDGLFSLLDVTLNKKVRLDVILDKKVR